MFGLSFVASALLLASGVAAQPSCDSLRTAIQSYSQQTENAGLDKSITTFNALLDVLGVDDKVISQFGSSNVLVPTDQAFVNLVSQIGGPDVEPLNFVMTHPNTFKQIILYHFTGPMKGASSGEAHTALAAMERLTSFIDTSAICGREDAKYIKIQYKTEEGKFTLTEPVAKHYTANAVETVCDTEKVTVTTINQVLTPCPTNMHFPSNLEGEFGCMSVAMAASKIEGHPFGTLPYEDSASPVISSLKHPNVLASAGDQFTVFVPTVQALDTAGVTSAEFLALPGALDHVVKGHVAQREVCIGDQIPATAVKTLADDDQFCDSDATLTMVASAPNTIKVVSESGDEASTTDINNIAVCGGLVHVVDAVLLPCKVDEYSPAAATDDAQAERGAASNEDGSSTTSTTTTVPDGAASVVAGTVATLAAAIALLM